MADCENEMRRSENSDWEVGGVAEAAEHGFDVELRDSELMRV